MPRFRGYRLAVSSNMLEESNWLHNLSSFQGPQFQWAFRTTKGKVHTFMFFQKIASENYVPLQTVRYRETYVLIAAIFQFDRCTTRPVCFNQEPLTAKPISLRWLSVTASPARRKKAKLTWLLFAPVSSIQWAKTPFTEINTFTLSSSELG